MSAHTPGPWIHVPEDNIITAHTTNGTCRLFEWTARSSHVPIGERDANARLIAAAPDGYALAKMIDDLSSSPYAADYVATEVQAAARALLAKVDGIAP